MDKDEACKMDRQNKNCSCARKSGRRKNNEWTHKEEKRKLAGPLAMEKLPAEGFSTRSPNIIWQSYSSCHIDLVRMNGCVNGV